jgi:peptide/nickel transport system permease protein
MTIAPGTGQEDTGAILEAAETAAIDGAVAIKGRTPWQIVWGRLRRDKVTMVALFASGFCILLAIAAPILAHFEIIKPDLNHPDLVTGLGSMPTGFGGGLSWSHPLGVEPGTGRDIFARILTGLTTSLTVAILATLISLLIGVILGIIAGFARGRTDWWISRFMDLVLSFPSVLMLLSLQLILVQMIANAMGQPASAAPPKIVFMIIVLGFFGFPQIARIIRGQVLSLREREFIEAAQSLGAKRGRIYFKELLPHLWAPILVFATLIMPANIAAEATLGFLGVGLNPPASSLGSMLNASVNYALPDPAFFLIPGLAVFFVVLAFNLLGDGLRDALDPKSGRS